MLALWAYYFFLFIIYSSISYSYIINSISFVHPFGVTYSSIQGAVCVSMSIYQTLFCFVCAHLTSGEKEVDQLKRNAAVQEIHRRTIFRSDSGFGLPKTIFDHE